MVKYSQPAAAEALDAGVDVVFAALSDANRRAMVDRLIMGPASVSGTPLLPG